MHVPFHHVSSSFFFLLLCKENSQGNSKTWLTPCKHHNLILNKITDIKWIPQYNLSFFRVDFIWQNHEINKGNASNYILCLLFS